MISVPHIRLATRSLWRMMTTMANTGLPPRPPAKPLIVVIGSTGTGKSKLAVDLAARFNGEIINADATQLYKGLPIVTNKIPQSERNGIPHHLLDSVELHEQTWTVHQFVMEADKVIREVWDRGKMPVVVGGTMYYVLGLLFRDSTLVSAEERASSGDEDNPRDVSDADSKYDSDAASADLSILSEDTPTSTILAKLTEFDPVIAARWHPRDRRKIVRSLEIYLRTGKKASEIYAEQAEMKASNAEIDQFSDTPIIEYDPVIFWLDAEDKPLKQRLDARVDSMMQCGLMDEVKAMRVYANNTPQGVTLDQGKGVWQAIGYKELCPYLDLLASVSGVEKNDQLERSWADGVEMIKGGTRRYAKRQNRYIRIRFAKELQERGLLHRLFLLDTSDLSKWNEVVAKPSEDIVDMFLSGAALPIDASLANRAGPISAEKREERASSPQARRCEICDKTMMSEADWKRHIESKSHQKVKDSKNKREKMQAYLNQRKANTTVVQQ